MTLNAARFAALLLIALPLAAQPLNVETLAGANSGGGYADYRFSAPRAIATDAAGNLYVADTGNHAIRKIGTDGSVVTLAGLPGAPGGFADGSGPAARFRFPAGIAVDPASGMIYISDKDNHVIRRMTPDGIVTTIAGEPGVAGSADAQGTAAKFGFPRGLVVGRDGLIYVADTGNHVIRRVTPDGIATTFVGRMRFAGSADGTGTAATFNQPSDIAVDPVSGDFFVADYGSSRIRRVTPAGVVTTVAPNAQLRNPWGLDVDSTGTIWVADHDNHQIRRIIPPSTFGVAAEGALFPSSIAIGPNDTVYVADTFHHVISRVTSNRLLATVAGSKPEWGRVNATATAARFAWPIDVDVDAAGTIWVAQAGGGLRRVTPAGVVSDAPIGLVAVFGVAVSPVGDVFYSDLLNDRVRSLGGVEFAVPGPRGLDIDATGNLYVASDDHTIKLIAPGGAVSTFAGGNPGYFDGPASRARFSFPLDVVLDEAGNLYVTDWGNNAVRKVAPNGDVTTFASGINGPNGITRDARGNLYVSDYDHVIRRIAPDGTMTIVAGLQGSPGNVDGVGERARFLYPAGMAVTAAGQLIIADEYNHAVKVGTPFVPNKRRPARR